MSIHYLIDPFTVTGEIVDVITSDTGQTPATGSTIIRIPDGVAIHSSPTNLSDLLTAKYSGLLASYAGFTNIVADPCLDPTNINLASILSSRLVVGAGLVHHRFNAPVGFYISNAITLPVAPTQCVVVWEEYTFTDSDEKNDRFQRTYVEASGSILTCLISFDGATPPFRSTGNGEVFNIPIGEQGTSFKILFWRVGDIPIYLGSWALIF
jgi:hypothetical protein